MSLRWIRYMLVMVGLAMALHYAELEASAAGMRLTYYLPTGNPTASGAWPYPGSAACSYNLPFGSIVELPDGTQLVCIDRGHLGAAGWVDVFVHSHAEGQAMIARNGTYPDIQVLRVGW